MHGLSGAAVNFLCDSAHAPWYPDIWCLQEIHQAAPLDLGTFAAWGSAVFVPRSDSPLHGGGLAIVVNKNIYDIELHDSCDTTQYGNRAEWLCADVTDHIIDRRFRIMNVYLRPNAALDFRAFFADIVSQVRPDIICGDFNARNASWDPGSYTHDTGGFTRGRNLARWIGHYGLQQSVSVTGIAPTTTAMKSAVDFFLFATRVHWAAHRVETLSNSPQVVSRYGTSLSDHYPVIVEIPSRIHPTVARRARQIKWDLVLPEHLDRVTLLLARMSRTPESLYRAMRHCVRILPRTTWRAGMVAAHQVPKDIDDLTTAWRHIRPRTVGAVPSVPLEGPGRKYYGPRAKAQALNQVFAEKHSAHYIFPPSSGESAPTYREDPEPCPPAPPITTWEVRTAIRKLKSSGAPDNDGITPCLMQWCIAPLSAALPEIFDRILGNPSLLPREWKDTTMVPLLKSGKDPSQLGSYRPICIYSLLSRTLESVLARRLVASIAQTLHARQYGFKAGRSAYDALGTILGSALLACHTDKNTVPGSTRRQTRQRGTCLVAYLDLSDAFCRVPHQHLLSALSSKGTTAYLVRFIHHWLRDRTARTFVSGRYSDRLPLNAGVPQGSVLGPLLFSIFMDSLVRKVSNSITATVLAHPGHYGTCAAYADDFTLLVCGYDPKSILQRMQTLVKVVDVWCLESGMVLSTKSVFQWICTAFRGLNTYITSTRNQAPVIRITRKRPPTSTTPTVAAPTLSVRGGRLVVASPNEDTVEFPTLMKQSHTYLGVVVDYRLRFMDHLTFLRNNALAFLSRMDALLPRVHPRVGRSLALAAAGSLSPTVHPFYIGLSWKTNGRCTTVLSPSGTPLSRV